MKKIFAFVLIIITPLLILLAQDKNTVQLRVDPPFFSPDGNGIQDQAFFYPVVNLDEILSRWQLNISNEKGDRIKRISGAGMVALVPWDGTDKKGQPVPEGKYIGIFQGWGKAIHIKSDPVFVTVDRTPPVVNVQVSTTVLSQALNGKTEISFYPTVLETSGLDRWQVQVLDAAGRTVYVDWSTGPIRPSVWDAHDKQTGVLVPEGRYIGVFEAWDAAGNESKPSMVDFQIKITPAEILRNVLKKIIVYETPDGLITQLKKSTIFDEGDLDVELSEQGKEFLRETAILLNAYPSLPVRLEGYCQRFKSAEKNKNISSVYGWRVYSDLVKRGNVKPSRLSVRGQGRIPASDRLVDEPKPIKEGVEVILEGHQKW